MLPEFNDRYVFHTEILYLENVPIHILVPLQSTKMTVFLIQWDSVVKGILHARNWNQIIFAR